MILTFGKYKKSVKKKKKSKTKEKILLGIMKYSETGLALYCFYCI